MLFWLTKAQINCKINNCIKNPNENYSNRTSPRCQKSCFWSPWKQSCWSHYRFHTGCNREVFQRAPFIVQITNGTFMPPDKWQMIICRDTTETTHLSYRYTQHKQTAGVVCVCLSVCLLKSRSSICAIIGNWHTGKRLYYLYS